MVLATVPVRGARQADLIEGSVLFEEDSCSPSRPGTASPDASRSRSPTSPTPRCSAPRPASPTTGTRRSPRNRRPTVGPSRGGPGFDTIQEMLALVGAGKGTYPSPPRPASTTSAPTSRTSPSATPHPSSGDSSGSPPRRPHASAPSTEPPRTRRRPARPPLTADDGGGTVGLLAWNDRSRGGGPEGMRARTRKRTASAWARPRTGQRGR